MTKTSSVMKLTDDDVLIVGIDAGASTGSNTTASVSSVASSASSVTLMSANADRCQAMVFNDSTQVLYLRFGNAAASTTTYTVQVAAGGYYELPTPTYQGEIRGIWPIANGNARVTEVE